MITINGELYHHGVKGMKWGVRRYQNYDGTYTQKGLEHFRESERNYESARSMHKQVKNAYKQTKKNGYAEMNGQRVAITKGVVKESKQNLKEAKRQMSRDYDQLRKDKAGDKGKELYRSGKTITGNATRLQVAGLIATGTTMAASYLAKNGRKKEAQYVALAGIGMEAANALLAVKGGVEAHYLRAYYSHSRADRPYADKIAGRTSKKKSRR